MKFQKCPKTILKVSKQVLKLFWGNFFWKKSPSAPWSVETWKNSKKPEKLSIFQNAQKTFPKAIKHVWNMLRGIFAGEKFRPVHPGGSRSRKTSKNRKTFNFQNAQIRSQKCSNLFSTCFEVFFPVKKFAQCTLEGREIEKFQKMEKIQFFKIPKNVSKSVQISFEVIFSELFLTSAAWRSKLVEIRKKNRKKLNS